MALTLNINDTMYYHRDVQQSMGLAQTYFTNPDYLVLQCWVCAIYIYTYIYIYISPDTINQTEPQTFHYTKFFEGAVGYASLVLNLWM